MDISTVTDTAILALATATISQTSARAKITAPMREWVQGKNAWLGELAACPYCTSHWVAFGLVLIYQPRWLHRFLPLDLVIATFAIVALATFIGGGMAYLTFHPEEPPRTPTEYDMVEKEKEKEVI